jgi:hypothetical protein
MARDFISLDLQLTHRSPNQQFGVDETLSAPFLLEREDQCRTIENRGGFQPGKSFLCDNFKSVTQTSEEELDRVSAL